MKFVLLGFVPVGLLLLTNHWGMAIRITNYLFIILLFSVIYETIFFKK